MTKKTGLIAIAVLVVLAVFAMFTISRMRARMMGGGEQIELMAVSADGEQISPSADVTSVTGELAKGTAAQKSGDLIVLLALNPYPPSVGQGDFDVTLLDANGQVINDASISLDLTMPAMRMPSNQPSMEFVANGQYHAAGYYTMRGWWRIEVIITRGAETQSVFFDLGL
ncbi:MAG: FixH family protein [Chloroflexi bacterium]|nr:FixH family protein [Chloroflexota bacterium]